MTHREHFVHYKSVGVCTDCTHSLTPRVHALLLSRVTLWGEFPPTSPGGWWRGGLATVRKTLTNDELSPTSKTDMAASQTVLSMLDVLCSLLPPPPFSQNFSLWHSIFFYFIFFIYFPVVVLVVVCEFFLRHAGVLRKLVLISRICDVTIIMCFW